jgi:hypothetical protein
MHITRNTLVTFGLALTLAACGGEAEAPEAEGEAVEGAAALLSAEPGKYTTVMQLTDASGKDPAVEMLAKTKGAVSQYSMCLDDTSATNALLAALEAQKWDDCSERFTGEGETAGTARVELQCTSRGSATARGAVNESGEGMRFEVSTMKSNPETGDYVQGTYLLTAERDGDC